MAEKPSCHSPYHEECIQTSTSDNPEGLCRSTYSREKINADFSAVTPLPMFIKFLSSNFASFILCSHKLFDIFAAPT